MTRVWRYAMRSEVGLVRAGNEDAAFAGQHLIAVADGMGGHAAGEVASAAAIAALTRLDENYRPGWDTVKAMRRAVDSANATLREIVAADAELQGMGTTITAAMLEGDRLVLAHVGDSRAYLLRDGALRQLTDDHTYVQQLVDDGRLSRDEVSSHPQRNLITRSLDGRADLDVDVVYEDIRAGDRYLVCSDGLSGVVTDATLSRALGAGTPDDAADSLISLALRAGGPDNITCIVAEVVEVDEAAAPQPGEVAGAAGDADAQTPSTAPAGGAAVSVAETSAAPRPAALTGAADIAPTDPDDPRVRSRTLRRRRGLITGIVVAVLLGAGAIAGWSVVQSQYYVGVADGEVAIFKGVRGSVLGRDLSSVHTPTALTVSSLPDFAQEEVRDGIHAEDLADAQAIVERLRDSAGSLTPAPPTSPSPVPTPRTGAPASVVPASPR